jgi:hypothetical protein
MPNDELTPMMREIVSSLYTFMLQIDDRIKAFDRKIAAIGDGSDFKNGRIWRLGSGLCRASIRAAIAGR